MPMLRLPSARARRAALALLAAAAALPAARADGPCLDNETWVDSSVTHIEFVNATLVTNTLHEVGGELRFEGVGVIRDTPVSLVVTDASADNSYPSITESWDARGLDYDQMNGINGKLGKINLQTVRGDADSGKGTFNFCFVDTATGAPMKAEKFVFPLYDIDERNYTSEGPPVMERAFFHTQNATAYQLWPTVEESDVDVGCEDGSAPPCVNTRWQLLSTQVGTGADNPNDPANLTPLQARRAIAITFENTDCFEFEYDFFCPVDTGEMPSSNYTRCAGKYRQGGNFLWGGKSERLINGECVPLDQTTSPSSVPTDSPSEDPSSSPSSVPTGFPTDHPSASPSSVPTGSPTKDPSASPSSVPTGSPSEDPLASPSSVPTDSPTKDPSAPPSTVPTGSPSEGPSASPSFMPTGSPTEDPSASPSSVPTGSPTEDPSASPSSMPTGSPTEDPSASPSATPSSMHSGSPSETPSAFHSSAPTGSPSMMPSDKPSKNPSASPSSMPTDFPSMYPSAGPSLKHSGTPTDSPSVVPSASYLPSDAPSELVTCAIVSCCFDCFCCGPGTSWSEEVGTCVLDPSSSGCLYEADEEVCYAGYQCTAGACCPPGTDLEVNPNYPLAERCYCIPEG